MRRCGSGARRAASRRYKRNLFKKLTAARQGWRPCELRHGIQQAWSRTWGRTVMTGCSKARPPVTNGGRPAGPATCGWQLSWTARTASWTWQQRRPVGSRFTQESWISLPDIDADYHGFSRRLFSPAAWRTGHHSRPLPLCLQKDRSALRIRNRHQMDVQCYPEGYSVAWQVGIMSPPLMAQCIEFT